MSVLLETSLGDIVIDLFCDQAPLACENFLKLCKPSYPRQRANHNEASEDLAPNQLGSPPFLASCSRGSWKWRDLELVFPGRLWSLPLVYR